MQVTMFKATDGQLFDTFDAYAKHEETIKLQEAISAVELNLGSFYEDDRGSLVLASEDIGKFVVANADALRVALATSKPVLRVRGRRPGTKNKPKTVEPVVLGALSPAVSATGVAA